MASTFPAAIANEPPPLDVSSEDEDSEEFRSHGLKLDVPSGEPTPVSTPFKRPFNNKSPDKVKTVESNRTNEEFISAVPQEDNSSSSEEVYATADDGGDDNRIAPTPTDKCEQINGVEDDSDSDKVETKTLTKKENEDETPFQEETLQQEIGLGLENATNHCDSSTKLNYTNSSIPQSLQLCVDAEPLVEDEDDDCAADKDAVWDEQHSIDTSEATKSSSDQESSTGVIDALDKQQSDPTTSPSSEDKSEEFLDFQAFETAITSENEENVKSSIDDNDSNTVEPDLVATTVESCQDVDIEDEDDDDFGAFQSIPQPPPQEQGTFLDGNNDEDDDDFGDFAHNSVQTLPRKSENVPPTSTNQLTAQTSQELMEDFADFQDCSFQSCDGASFVRSASAPSDIALITSKVDSIIKSLFVIDPDSSIEESETKKPNSIDAEISMSSDSTWARIQDFEGSHGLMFKWLSSLTGKRLLRSLNINTSNLVYHEKWGTIEVPKFAASLVQSPLQPQSCNKFESQGKMEDLPAIVNNNTIMSDDHNKPPSISTEAQEILRQLPELSYMRANTLVFPQTSPSGL